MTEFEERPLILSTEGFPRLRRLVRPLRRFLAWFCLVYEERHWRLTADRALEAAVQEAREARAVAEWASQEIAELQARLIERGDLLTEEVWRRSEIALAAQAREVQRLQEEMTRVTRENTAVLRLLADAKPATTPAVGHEQNGGHGARAGRVPSERSAVAGGSAVAAMLVSSNGSVAPYAQPIRPTIDDFHEELERGSRDEVMEKAHRYLQHFRSSGPVVDLGCGRGEFLELLSWAGIEAYGVDIDPRAIQRCHELGLDARVEDLFDHLGTLAGETLGGVYCAQVVEHLPPERLSGLMADVARTLSPGARAVIETPNPATFATHMHSFWRDPTHVRPVPAPSLATAARAAGLVVEDVVYSSPPPEDERLQRTDAEAFDPPLRDLARAFNRTVTQLNEVLYGHQDYALVAVKPA